MLQIDRPDRPLPQSLLHAHGGFAWWYADALDTDGNGFVCIWSFGLPFLPGYLSAHRAGRGVPAGARPSLNLAIYRDGKPVSYALLELDPDRVTWAPERWTFGDSVLWREPRGEHTALIADLDLPIPGDSARLTGHFEVVGPFAKASDRVTENPQHAWTPLLGPSTASFRFEVGGRTLVAGQGSGYHDRNGSEHPMDGLGLDHWIWTRAVVGDQLVITYLNFPDAPGAEPYHVAVLVDGHGAVTVHDGLEATLEGPTTATFGMPWWRRATLRGLSQPLVIDFARPFDDGPFYLRTWTTLTLGTTATRGIAELCRPHRIDRGWQRPLVRMCVQHETGRDSLWAPLFLGPSDTRLQRLARHWLRGGRVP